MLQNTHQYSNNQIENSHLHFRRREKMMNKFRSYESLQKFTSIHTTFLNHFNHQRHIENRHNLKKNYAKLQLDIVIIFMQYKFMFAHYLRKVIISLTALFYLTKSYKLQSWIEMNLLKIKIFVLE